jgi:hypothetical protein
LATWEDLEALCHRFHLLGGKQPLKEGEDVTAQDSLAGSNEEKTEGVIGLVGRQVGQRARKPNPRVCVRPKWCE